jgi:hypothetical protein
MNSGYVAVLDQSFAGDDLEASGQATTGDEYVWYATPTGTNRTTLNKGTADESQVGIYTGRVLWRTTEEAETHYVSGEKIRRGVEERTTTHAAEFVAMPAKGLALLSDESMVWYVERLLPCRVSLPEIDIRGYVQDHEENAQQWGTGFAGRLPDSDSGDGVRKGAVYGDDVKQDPQLGEDVRRGYLNQVGVDYPWRHHQLTAYLAESGYVAAWADDITTAETMAWLAEEVAPVIREEGFDEDADPETPHETEDDQQSLDDLDTVNDPGGGA